MHRKTIRCIFCSWILPRSARTQPVIPVPFSAKAFQEWVCAAAVIYTVFSTDQPVIDSRRKCLANHATRRGIVRTVSRANLRAGMRPQIPHGQSIRPKGSAYHARRFKKRVRCITSAPPH